MNCTQLRRVAARIAVASLAISAIAMLPRRIDAQGTTPVPTSDLVYRDLDRLSELSFLDSVIVGQRPYSRREIGRILRTARDRSDRLGERTESHRITDLELSIGDGILRRLEARFSPELDQAPGEDPVFSLLDGISLVYGYTDAERRRFPAGHTRPIAATIDPLVPRRLGRPVAPGHTTAVELAHRIEPTNWLSLHVRERFELRSPLDSTRSSQDGEVLVAGVRARVRNVALSVGREPLAWSQSEDAGLFFGSDAPAIDQVSLASDRPFVMPGVLRWFGPAKATLVVADLGPTAVRSRSKLLAYKVSVQPSRRSELGATFMNHFGGRGGRSSSTVNRVIDFLPIIDIFRRHNYYDSTSALDVDSDKLLGIDGRLRVGGLRGVLFTGELLIDDFDVRRIPKLLTGYGSQSLGITVPRFISPLLSLELTAKHMGILTYSHGLLTNGIASRGRLLGDELGPDSKAFGAELRWQPTAAVLISVGGRRAIYSNAEYGAYYADADSTRYVVQKLSRTADEIRDRLLTTILVQSEEGAAISLRGGAQRSRNYEFRGVARNDFVVELALHLQR